MDIAYSVISLIIFALLTLLAIVLMVYVSSAVAILALLMVPLMCIFIMPDTALSFLAFRHIVLAEGNVPINNYHVLLFVWSTVIGMIVYSEIFTWYLGRREPKKTPVKTSKAKPVKNIISSVRGIAAKAGSLLHR
jgi:predicted membrane protein